MAQKDSSNIMKQQDKEVAGYASLTPGEAKTAPSTIVTPLTPFAPAPGSIPLRSEEPLPYVTVPEQAEAQGQRINRVASMEYAMFGTLPVRPNTVGVVSLSTFACGLYLMPGVTGGGKTQTAVSLIHAVKRLTVGKVDTNYHYIYESRAAAPQVALRPESSMEQTERTALAGVKGLVSVQAALESAGATSTTTTEDIMTHSGSRELAIFSEPARFLADLMYVYRNRSTGSKPVVCAVDSLTLAIKQAYPYSRSGSPAGEKGVQPADIKFIFELSRFCLMHNIVMFGLLNAQIIQFTEILEGVCEGQIKLVSQGIIQKRDRIRRAWVNIALPREDVTAARDILGYGPEEETQIFIG
jgi:hypothetical protein